MKKTHIEYCGDCPHRFYKDNELHCEKTDKATYENNRIPDWCPLPDAEVKPKPKTFEEWLGAEKYKEYDCDFLAMMRLAWEAGHL